MKKFFISVITGFAAPLVIALTSLSPAKDGGLGFVILLFSPIILIVSLVFLFTLKRDLKEKYNLNLALAAFFSPIILLLLLSTISFLRNKPV